MSIAPPSAAIRVYLPVPLVAIERDFVAAAIACLGRFSFLALARGGALLRLGDLTPPHEVEVIHADADQVVRTRGDSNDLLVDASKPYHSGDSLGTLFGSTIFRAARIYCALLAQRDVITSHLSKQRVEVFASWAKDVSIDRRWDLAAVKWLWPHINHLNWTTLEPFLFSESDSEFLDALDANTLHAVDAIKRDEAAIWAHIRAIVLPLFI